MVEVEEASLVRVVEPGPQNQLAQVSYILVASCFCSQNTEQVRKITYLKVVLPLGRFCSVGYGDALAPLLSGSWVLAVSIEFHYETVSRQFKKV